MNRIEEALRRASQQPSVPESHVAADADALDRFASVEQPTELPAEIGRSADAKSRERVVSDIDVATGTAPPSESRSEELPVFNPALSGKLVIGDEVKAITVEQYRRLAATLHQSQCDAGTKVVMVASAMAGEGKTVTAVNLALTLSESYGRRVLLIDADFRRPTLHEVFQVPNVSGLNDALKADADRKLTILEISPRLSLLPAGRPNPDPMSGLTSGRMQRIIDEAAEKFDWVILDTPPIGLITDANLLATMVHTAVLVVQAGRTPCGLIQRAIERLDRSRVIGVVLNWVEDRAATPDGKYGKYYNTYYATPEPTAVQVASTGPRA